MDTFSKPNKLKLSKKSSKKEILEDLPKDIKTESLEDPSNKMKSYDIIEVGTYNELNYQNEGSKKRYKKTKCPGCYPVFQPNQLGHIGPNGCLGDD
jgi:hypothetical protein